MKTILTRSRVAGRLLVVAVVAFSACLARSQPASTNFTRVAAGLTNPRHIRFGPGGLRCVAEAGVLGKTVRINADVTSVGVPSFTKVTTGPVVTNVAAAWGAAWGDIDNDGFIDLHVGNEGVDFLYHNNRDGTFASIINSPVVMNDSDGGDGGAFADYDNDGHLDLIVGGYGGPRNKLFHNNGDGTFTRTTGNAVVAEGDANSTHWGDYNQDGYVDLLIVSSQSSNIRLFRNSGGGSGSFTKMTAAQAGPILAETERAVEGIWSDFDNDGDLDVLVIYYMTGRIGLYRNHGNGTFSSRLLRSEVGDLEAVLVGPLAAAWGDYDNDGDLDLFATQANDSFLNGLTSDVLFRNNGQGAFTQVTTTAGGPLVNELQPGGGCAWADYDNDGWLDLYVANPGLSRNAGESGRKNLLYHNNGDGSFTQITTGSLVNDQASSVCAISGDYDNDGFMDLFVANGGYAGRQADALYRNNGNANAWLKLNLVGTVSNRAAIGAKVRVKAIIQGKVVWQMREISGGDGFLSQNDMRPNFGLGDATLAETVRIEWPSGILQELRNVPAKQILTVTEPPSLAPIVKVTNEMVELTVRGWKGFTYVVEASSDLHSWTQIGTATNFTGVLQVTMRPWVASHSASIESSCHET
ncbi:MAG: CRTAC1 family protein [Verrucomicrobiota bacterium]